MRVGAVELLGIVNGGVVCLQRGGQVLYIGLGGGHGRVADQPAFDEDASVEQVAHVAAVDQQVPDDAADAVDVAEAVALPALARASAAKAWVASTAAVAAAGPADATAAAAAAAVAAAAAARASPRFPPTEAAASSAFSPGNKLSA